MICCSENCPKSNTCGRHLKNYTTKNGIVNTIEALATFGSGNIDSQGNFQLSFLCGPNGGYEMYEEYNTNS